MKLGAGPAFDDVSTRSNTSLLTRNQYFTLLEELPLLGRPEGQGLAGRSQPAFHSCHRPSTKTFRVLVSHSVFLGMRVWPVAVLDTITKELTRGASLTIYRGMASLLRCCARRLLVSYTQG